MNVAIVASVSLVDNRALVVYVVFICICNMLSGFNPSLIQLKNNFGLFLSLSLSSSLSFPPPLSLPLPPSSPLSPSPFPLSLPFLSFYHFCLTLFKIGTFLGTLIPGVSYSRWILEACYLLILLTYKGVYDISISLQTWDYHLDDFWLSIGMLLFYYNYYLFIVQFPGIGFAMGVFVPSLLFFGNQE